MSGWPCSAPEFVWLGIYWSACVRCGRVAWEHEQCDPLADTRNHIRQVLHGLSPGSYPPAMRPWTGEADA